MKQFQIDKTNPNRFRIKQTVDSPDNAQTEGAGKAKNVVIKIERFAFTANNLTYYMVGDKLGYFHPLIQVVTKTGVLFRYGAWVK